ncbi:MAG: right-handed parallel beta-helix repeat-containing protein [Patulibacter sp.]|nr:right-handed parallel beta-helix repeat-containing protein [Patulibacter sp.]
MTRRSTHRSRLRAGIASATALLALATASSAAAAPTTPSGLQAVATGPQQVSLAWTASTSAVSGYHVYRNGTLIGTSNPNAASYLDDSSSLVNNTSYSYTVDAFDATGSSAASAAVTAVPKAATANLTGCLNVPGSGHVKLTADITANSTTPCFKFGSTTANSNLSLDCQGHTVTQNGPADVIDIIGYTGFIVSNCVFVQNTSGGKVVKVSGGSYGRFVKSTFRSPNAAGLDGASLDIESSPFTIIGSSTSTQNQGNVFDHAYLEFHGSADSYAGYNSSVQQGNTSGAAIYVAQSDRTSVVNNSIDGGYVSNGTGDNGLDSGIMLYGPNDKLNVNGNTVSNTYNSGVESLGSLQNSQLKNNTFLSTAAGGIVGYYNTDFSFNTVSGNTITHSNHAFVFSATYNTGFTAFPSPGFRVAYNTFTGNTLSDPTGSDPSMRIALLNPADVPAGTTVAATVTGNKLIGNDFTTTLPTPLFQPADTTASPTTSTGNLCPSSTFIQCVYGKPMISATTATRRADRSYTLASTIDPSGGPTHVVFQLGTTTAYGTNLETDVAAGPAAQASKTTAVLVAGTTYHYRVVATNAAGTATGLDLTFKP